MALYSFTMTLQEEVDDLDAVNACYGRVDDTSLGGAGGHTFIDFDREADSLESALHSALIDVSHQQWHVREILIEPDCLLPVA